MARVLECVVNVSEGRDEELLHDLVAAGGDDLLDTHSDPSHHRTVLTVVGTEAPRRIARVAVARIDLTEHVGVHPRIGAVDVVPFVPLAGSTMADAVKARNEFGEWAASELGVPCFFYGRERTLPEVRRTAWATLAPDTGPAVAHPTAGAICVGARGVLVAYNVWLAEPDLTLATRTAALIRGPSLRALGLAVGDHVQVSMNLVDPAHLGPDVAYDLVARHAAPARAELVGLIPADVLTAIPSRRWRELDLAPERTIEHRLESRRR